jgi:hypothetical protein
MTTKKTTRTTNKAATPKGAAPAATRKAETAPKTTAPAAPKGAAPAATRKTETAPKTTAPAPQKTPRAASPAAKPAETKAAPAKTATKPAAPKPTPDITPEERWQMISEAAYFLAEQRGFSGGNPCDDWIQAELQVDTELRQRAAGK